MTSEMDKSNSKSATMPEEAQTRNDKQGSTRRSDALVASPKGSEDSTITKLSTLSSEKVFELMTVAKDGPVQDFLKFWGGFDLNSTVGTSGDYHFGEPLEDYAWKDARGKKLSFEFVTTALHMAAANGQADIVEQICSVEHIQLNLQDTFGYTPLHLAANSRHVNRDRVIDKLMHRSHAHLVNANAADKSPTAESPNDKSPTAESPNDKSPIQERLLIPLYNKFTPLHLAVMADFRDDQRYIVEKFFQWKPKEGPYYKSIIDVSARSGTEGLTPLHIVLEKRKEINEWDLSGIDMIVTLVQFMNTNCPEAINKPDFEGRTALHYCVENRDHTALDTLLREGDKINPVANDNQGKTPLDIAVDKGNYVMVQKLQNYLEVSGLYGNQDAYAAAANALLVVATLLATVTYTSQITLAESTLYWVFSNLSFYFAISTLLVAAGVAMPSRGSTLDNLRNAVYGASVCLAFSISCAIGAFGTAGFLSLPPGIHYDEKVVATTTIGGILCLYCLVGFVRKLAKAYSPIFLYADYRRRHLVNEHLTEPLTERLLKTKCVLGVERWYIRVKHPQFPKRWIELPQGQGES
jgi:ankyrin repeat protein